MDRHRFDADLNPDPTCHFDADLNPTPSFTKVGKSGFLFTYSQQALFYLYRQYIVSVFCTVADL